MPNDPPPAYRRAAFDIHSYGTGAGGNITITATTPTGRIRKYSHISIHHSDAVARLCAVDLLDDQGTSVARLVGDSLDAGIAATRAVTLWVPERWSLYYAYTSMAAAKQCYAGYAYEESDMNKYDTIADVASVFTL